MSGFVGGGAGGSRSLPALATTLGLNDWALDPGGSGLFTSSGSPSLIATASDANLLSTNGMNTRGGVGGGIIDSSHAINGHPALNVVGNASFPGAAFFGLFQNAEGVTGAAPISMMVLGAMPSGLVEDTLAPILFGLTSTSNTSMTVGAVNTGGTTWWSGGNNRTGFEYTDTSLTGAAIAPDSNVHLHLFTDDGSTSSAYIDGPLANNNAHSVGGGAANFDLGTALVMPTGYLYYAVAYAYRLWGLQELMQITYGVGRTFNLVDLLAFVLFDGDSVDQGSNGIPTANWGGNQGTLGALDYRSQVLNICNAAGKPFHQWSGAVGGSTTSSQLANMVAWCYPGLRPWAPKLTYVICGGINDLLNSGGVGLRSTLNGSVLALMQQNTLAKIAAIQALGWGFRIVLVTPTSPASTTAPPGGGDGLTVDWNAYCAWLRQVAAVGDTRGPFGLADCAADPVLWQSSSHAEGSSPPVIGTWPHLSAAGQLRKAQIVAATLLGGKYLG